MLRLLPLLLFVWIVTPRSAAAQAPDPSFEEIMVAARAEGWHTLPMGPLMQRIGRTFLGRPYEAGLLDASTDELLIAPLDRFDCVLFVESVLALAQTIVEQSYDHASYLGHVRDQRYRDGKMNGYCSRLHYFTEWISDNARRGTVVDLTKDLGGRPFDKTRTFMGSHRAAYAQLATNDSLFAGLRAVEERLRPDTLYVIEQGRIRTVYDRVQAGDIVAFATSVDGLDVSHTGLIHVSDTGRVGLLHASLDRGVVVSTDLQSYVENNRSQVGIVVARAADPRTSLGNHN